MFWIDVYRGLPDVLTQDAGKQVKVRVFQVSAELLLVETKTGPVESDNSSLIIECYHGPLRRAFRLIKFESSDLSNEKILQLAVRSIKDSIGPDALVSPLLVYGALPRPGFRTEIPVPTMLQRTVALRNATHKMKEHFAHTHIPSGLRAQDGPDRSDIRKAQMNSPVLSDHHEIDISDEVYHVQCADSGDCYVLLFPPLGLTKLRTIFVKRHFSPDDHW